MSRFLAVLNASNPQLVTDIEAVNGRIVVAQEPGVLVIDGDAATADAVAQIQSVLAVGPPDQAWDTSSLGLSDDAATAVASWNVRYSDDFIAAAGEGYRGGEEWDFPDGCFHSGIEGDETSPLPPDAAGGGPLVAENGPTDTTDPATTDTGQVADNSGDTGQVDNSGDTGQVADNGDTGTTDTGTTDTGEVADNSGDAGNTDTTDGNIA